MDQAVARLNIEHYRHLLAGETDDIRRQLLLRLLTEEETKLAEPERRGKTNAPRRTQLD